MKLIWCQGGNPASARLAVLNGWHYGSRSDDTVHPELGPVALLDCHWEPSKLDWPKHLDAAARFRPHLATVPDTLSPDEINRTLRQAEELAPHCDSLLIVPKCEEVIDELPRAIGSKPIILGFSVPTSYGGTEVPVWKFASWPVHLLGGSARRQLEYSGYLNTQSVDGNVAWRLARRGIVITDRGIGGPTIRQLDGQSWPADGAHLEALRRSFINLQKFWNRHKKIQWNLPS